MSDARAQADEAMALVGAIRLLLKGRGPGVQGAVLADLLATWLAGHVARGDPKATKRIREEALALHLRGVRALIEPNYKMSVEPQLKANTQ